MLYRPPFSFASDGGRVAEAAIAADLAGGRTILHRQRVGYPFHITRGFYLDRERPDLQTLYLQSASGGLYAGDRLSLDLMVGAGASLHLTTQAATVVHHGRGSHAQQRQMFASADNAFCAVTSDPYILFPGASLELITTATVAETGVLILADGFASHDPRGNDETFARFASAVTIRRPDGRLLMRDRGEIGGGATGACFGPLGEFTAAATVIVIAPENRRPGDAELERAADDCHCLAGASPAPFDAGVVVRLLAEDGGTLARGMDAVFHVAARAVLGIDLARRRK